MNDLPEFLLARIAEDEERGRNCQNWSECGEGYGCPAHMSPERWAAECEAKRRIVELVQATGLHGFGRLLSLPYADHSDYDEAWRP